MTMTENAIDIRGHRKDRNTDSCKLYISKPTQNILRSQYWSLDAGRFRQKWGRETQGGMGWGLLELSAVSLYITSSNPLEIQKENMKEVSFDKAHDYFILSGSQSKQNQ